MKKANNILRMPTVLGGIIIAIVAIVLLVISAMLFDVCAWASNVMISASCGIITGLVLYFLTNLRTNSYNKVKRDYDLLLKVRNDASTIIKDSTFYIKCHCLWDEDMATNKFFERIFGSVEQIQRIVFDQFTYELFQEVGLEENNPIDYSTTQKIWSQYIEGADSEEEIDNLLTQIIENQNQLISMLKEAMQKRRSKLEVYDKYNV